MFTKGEFTLGDTTYGVLLNHTKTYIEAVLITSGTVVSAYKTDATGSYSFNNTKAKEFVTFLRFGLKSCTSKNCTPSPFELGAMNSHEFRKSKTNYLIQLYKGEVVGAYAQSTDKRMELSYIKDNLIPQEIPYIKLTEFNNNLDVADDELDSVPVRTVQEIALEKEDVTWLQNKQYYIVNDDETAEKLFQFLENYNGIIAYDIETTGLAINMFGQIGSDKAKILEQYNKEHPDDQIRADRLVGIIFCVEPNISYYFPCFNRKFKNLYQDLNSPIRQRIINNTKSRYIIGDLRNAQTPMAKYVRETAPDEFRLDVILMERCRDILEKKHITTHGGSFEYKGGLLFCIDTNIKDDTIIMHQLMYKFRSTTRNSGEPSNLKYLAKVELGIDQWELKDFFPNIDESVGAVRKKQGQKPKKKKKSRIDFSYMDYPGTQIYAPADGDVTLQLAFKYKADLLQNHKDQEYIYLVEMIVMLAIGYMEFYGHRLDESKILGARDQTKADLVMIESEIRQTINYSDEKELEQYKKLKELRTQIEEFKGPEEELKKLQDLLIPQCEKLSEAIADNTAKVLNLASPAQVADLFYNQLGYPIQGDKPSVAKKYVKALLKETNEDGTPKCPVAHMYADYKNKDTQLTKFFDNLPYFMYPGGFIFSSYGQISTATGRMSCSKPNAQQYPKIITKIVIPRDGYAMIDADYSQIEYRVLTALAKNTELAKMFSDPDSDYHTLMASLMYDVPYASVTSAMRSAAKSFNFGIPYGMGFGSLAILLTGKNTPQTRDEAKEKYEQYFKNQPRTRKFFDDVKEQAQINGYTTTLFNRVRSYSFVDKDGNINQAKKAASLRQAGNAIIQGCESGDTLIQTKEYGIVQVQDVVDKHLHVWDGEKWSEGDILYSGKKQKCIITFSNGQKFVCSPIHKFLVKSHRGKERFVECKDLKTNKNSKNPHRIVITRKYEKSDWRYNSSEARYKFTSKDKRSKNVFLDDIGDSFKAGVVLGRLASDGNIVNNKNNKVIRQIIAEHEKDVYHVLKNYMEPLGTTEYHTGIREWRYEDIMQLKVHSTSLVNEITELDVKHKIHTKIFQDTEMLRGFLRGVFDGDGGISGETITLTFGTQDDFEPICRDIQKALLFFGIRSRYYKYDYRSKIVIKTNDNQKFLDTIGFINEDKQLRGRSLQCIRDEHVFGQVLIPESVEITDEYIDMYDVCNTDGGYYVADGIITHNTAADIFKIGVARNFEYIRRNKLFGKMLIINMIHDEQLLEVSVKDLNVLRILADIGKNMQFKLDNFPPLYIGAGVGPAWGYAKSKIAEIHPVLLDQLTEQAKTIPIYKDANSPQETVQDVLDFFEHAVYEFRRKKVADYLSDSNNWNKDIHPAIGGLINLQFNYGRGDEAKSYVGPNGEKYSDQEFLELNIADFLKENNIDAKPEYFKANETIQDTKQELDADTEYEDDEEDDENEFDVFSSMDDNRVFSLIDESNKLYGSNIQDLINIFGSCIIESQKICGINMKNLHFKKIDAIIDYLMNYVCDEDTPGALQLVFLKDTNVLNYTGIYVCGIEASEFETRYKTLVATNSSELTGVSDSNQGDINNRSAAK